MLKNKLGNKHGIALLITLSAIVLFMTVAVELNRKARSIVFSTAAVRDRLILKQMASSGIHAGMAILVRDRYESETDSIQDIWADPATIAALLNDIPFPEGKLTLTIHDELGKIQTNALVKFPEGRLFNESQKMLWYQFLVPLTSQIETSKETNPSSIISSVKDWLDSGDNEAITGLGGAESVYYQNLIPPYRCRNAPFLHLGELALVKGITPDLFHSVGGSAGLSKYMTIYGMVRDEGNQLTYEGKININTAELPVLAALLPLDQQPLAQAIYEYRSEISKVKNTGAFSDPAWYQNAPGCRDLKIDPKLITTSSNFFTIESTASLNELKISVIAAVERKKRADSGKWTCKILNWQTK